MFETGKILMMDGGTHEFPPSCRWLSTKPPMAFSGELHHHQQIYGTLATVGRCVIDLKMFVNIFTYMYVHIYCI